MSGTRRRDRGEGAQRASQSRTLLRGIGRDARIIPWSGEQASQGEWEVILEFAPVRGELYPSRLEIRPGVFEEGVPEGGITARLVHGIRVGELVEEFRREREGNLAAARLFFGTSGRSRYKLPPPTNKRGPRGLSERFYQEVALLYLEALRTEPRRPIEQLSRRYPGYPKSNVKDWVARAREKGYLSAPGPGRPGGRATNKLRRALREGRVAGRGGGPS